MALGRRFAAALALTALAAPTASAERPWLIYVKEHPSQLSGDGDLEAYRGRSPDDYDELLQLPNVRLGSEEVDSFSLVDNAAATATVTGTAGWESIVRGKPALVFGNAWFRWAPGAYYVQRTQDLVEALRRISATPFVDGAAAEDVCRAVQHAGFRLDPRGGIGLPQGMSDTENTDALQRALSAAAGAARDGKSDA